MVKPVAAFITALLLSGAAGAESEFRRYEVEAGSQIILSQPHTFNDTCKLGDVAITLASFPSLGDVVLGRGRYRMGDYGRGRDMSGKEGEKPCGSVSVLGPQVIYRAGEVPCVDRFVMEARLTDTRTVSVSYQIVIKE